ncbi:MAG: hypothetical protein ACE5GU_12755 [Candidatus Scalinduaceae bacterium]
MMKLIQMLFGLSIIIFILSANALALNIQVKKEEVEEAIKHGEEHGKDIFKCQDLKHACINFWPKQGGILVRSKFVDLTATASMWFNEGQKISDREIKDIVDFPYLKVEMRTKDDVVILLKQGEQIIEPVNTDYEDPCCELCRFSGGNRYDHDFVTSSFLYRNLDPNSKTTIIVKGPYREREYNIDLSRIK